MNFSKQQIRTGVWETNSSSTHSISISDGNYVINKILPDASGCISIETGEFGWEQETYSGVAMKASYIATAYLSSETRTQDEINELEDGELAYPLRWMRELFREYCGATTVNFIASGGSYNQWGYIDHQSHGCWSEAVASKDSLRDFLFNSSSYVETDNDNH